MKLDHDFWPIVHAEFTLAPHTLLCRASRTFKAAWDNNDYERAAIVQAARQFIASEPNAWFSVYSEDSTYSRLFVPTANTLITFFNEQLAAQKIAIRRNFLAYMLKQTRTTQSNEHKATS